MTTHRSATLTADDRAASARTAPDATPQHRHARAAPVAQIGVGWQVAKALGPVLAVIAAAVLATGAERVRGPGLMLFLIGMGMSTLDRSPPRR